MNRNILLKIQFFNKLNKNRYLNLGRNSSFETASDSDGILSNGGTLSRTINTYPSPPFIQVNVELNFDITKNLLLIHLINCEHVSLHSAFDEQAEFFIHIQMINNKLLKKFNDAWKKRQANLQLNNWKKQHEKTTKYDIFIYY